MNAIVHEAQNLSGTIVAVAFNAIWEGALLAACVYLALRLWPGLNATTRYAIWSATLIAAIAVPLFTSLPPAAFAPQTVAGSNATTRQATARHAPRPIVEQSRVTTATPGPVVPSRRRAFAIPPALALALAVVWLAFALLALLRLGLGLRKLEALKRDALPLSLEYRDRLSGWNAVDKGSRPVRLCISDAIDVPVAVGLFDSMILIPAPLLETLRCDEIDQICLHELAHLRRGDDWTNGLHRVVLAFFGWTPAAAFIGRQLELEREVACDDCVLSLTGAVRPYAMTLTRMAESTAWPHQPVPAPGVFATRKQISLRIERLLAAGRNAATNLSPAPAALAIALVGGLALGMQAIAPTAAAISPAPQTAAAPPASQTVAAPPASQAAAARTIQPAMQSAHREVVVSVHRTVERPVAPPTPPGPPAKPARTGAHVGAIDLHVAETNVHVPAFDVHVPATDVRVPPIDVNVPGDERAVADATACTGCDFSGVDWSGADKRNSHFTGADFTRARLVGTDFSNSWFKGPDFSHADLRNANFSGVKITGGDFAGANLAGANFNGAVLTGCDFAHVDLRHVDLSRATLTGTDLPDSHRSFR